MFSDEKKRYRKDSIIYIVIELFISDFCNVVGCMIALSASENISESRNEYGG